MHLKKVFLVILLLISNLGLANSPKDVAQLYFTSIKSKNYRASVEFMSAKSLIEFRAMFSFFEELPEDVKEQLYLSFFGNSVSKEAIKRLSDQEFYSLFFTNIMERSESVASIEFKGFDIIGSIKEKEFVHVLTRSRAVADEVSLENLEVLTFVREGNNWRLVLPAKMKGIASQIRKSYLSNIGK